MQIKDNLHLAYSTTIHASDGWENLFANLRQYVPPLKAKLSPDQPFGIGFRLSNRELPKKVSESTHRYSQTSDN